MKLLIISHTLHYYRNNELVGWSPTIMEINHLLNVFDEIYHIAVLSNEKAPESAIAYDSDNTLYSIKESWWKIIEKQV